MRSRADVVVYLRRGDPGCMRTVAALAAAGVGLRWVDVEAPGVRLPRLRELRTGPLPVVHVGDLVWGGYRPDKIALLAAMRGVGRFDGAGRRGPLPPSVR